MSRSGDNIYKYSTPFKKRVVKSLETGEYNVAEALRVFGCSKTSVYRWLRKYSKNYKIGKVVKVQNKDERDRLKELEGEVKHLREERDRAKLKNLALETLIKIADKSINLKSMKKYKNWKYPIPHNQKRDNTTRYWDSLCIICIKR